MEYPVMYRAMARSQVRQVLNQLYRVERLGQDAAGRSRDVPRTSAGAYSMVKLTIDLA
ncbi:MAG: hypothetical protein KJN63_00975 [Acidimicrobiia bacterium]|nr:hypothetical protein [Acidimicrobiia bacterium]